jgi:hypothetical protein
MGRPAKPDGPRGPSLAAISRRLRIRLSEQLGRRYAVRLRAYSGMLVLVDQDQRLASWYSWETDEPEDSPANLRHLAGIIETEQNWPPEV